MQSAGDASLQCRNGTVLRAPRLADAESLARHAHNRDVWINLRDRFPYPYAVEDAIQWIGGVSNERPRRSFIIAVNGEAVGGIGLVIGHDIERCSAEVGYWLGEQHWNRGIATAALDRICEYAFEEFGLLRIFATPLSWNPASFRVLEKAGFAKEGIMQNACIKDGKVVSMVLFAKLAQSVGCDSPVPPYPSA